MGTDATIFAVKAKRYFYYDRDYNLMDLDDAAPLGVAQALEAMIDHRPVSAHDVRALLVSSAGDSDHLGWRLAILRFVDAHPDDTFVRYTSSGTPDHYEMRERDGYTEWKDE